MDMAVRWVAVAVAVLSFALACHAQDDDLDGQWLAPTLDALDRFREDPLCLRCATASTLTQLPGISRRTATRITSACRSASITTIDELADSVCASPEQFLMLTACATLTCSCMTMIRSVRTRTRVRSDAASPYSARVDVSHLYGTAGVTVFNRSDRTYASGWLTASFSTVEISLGDLAFQSGTGLLLGTARTLMRRGVDVLPASTPLASARPWPSVAFDNAPRGVTALWTSSAWPLAVGASTWIDRSQSLTRPRTALHLGTRLYDVDLQATVLRDVNRSINGEAMSLAASFDRTVVRIAAEMRLRFDAVEGVHAMMGYAGLRTDLVAAIWVYAPDVILEYGTSALGSSQPRNQRGLHIAAHHRFASRLSIAGSATITERITRTYLDPLPSTATLLRSDVEFRPTRTTLLRLQLTQRRSDESVSSNDGRVMSVHMFSRFRFDCETALSASTLLRARVDVTNASVQNEPSQRGTLIAVMFRTRITPWLTASAQMVQWRSTSYDVASRVATLGVPGTFDMLVCSGTGTAFHAQTRIDLPQGFRLFAHARSELRAADVSLQWTLQAEWRLADSEQRPVRVGLMQEMPGD